MFLKCLFEHCCVLLSSVAYLAFLAFSYSVCAEELVVDGFSPYEAKAIDQSRYFAIQDARQQAGLQTEMELSTTTDPGNSAEDVVNLRNLGIVRNNTLIDERVEGDLFRVQMAATTGPGVYLPYRKKVVLTRFSVLHPSHIADIAALPEEYPKEIMRRLEGSGRFLVWDATEYSILNGDGPISLTRRENREEVRRVAALSDAQLVIAGIILDAGSTISQGFRTWIPGLEDNTRQIEIDLYLYDGINGNLLYTRRHVATAHGQVVVDREIPFASRRFLDTDFGSAVEKALIAQVRDVTEAMECLPFTARVIRTESDRVFINAGATSLLRPGDILSVSKREPMLPLLDLNNTSTLGTVDKYAGTITIVQVQPLFSIAHIDQVGVKLITGDYIHFREPFESTRTSNFQGNEGQNGHSKTGRKRTKN